MKWAKGRRNAFDLLPADINFLAGIIDVDAKQPGQASGATNFAAFGPKDFWLPVKSNTVIGEEGAQACADTIKKACSVLRRRLEAVVANNGGRIQQH